MHKIALNSESDWSGWRQAARQLALAGIEPAEVRWTVGGKGDALPDASGGFHLSRSLVELMAVAFQVRQPDRFGLLYSLVWRVQAGETPPPDDPDLALARRWALSVRADAHRMRTNTRFLRIQEAAGACRYLGWFAPRHFVLPANAQLVARRFPDLTWSIITPDGSAHWDRASLRFGAGLRHTADDETLLAWWEAHQAAILDDATEGTSIPAAEAVDESPRPPDLAPVGPVVVPSELDPSLAQPARDIWACRRCHLYEPATQPVFGEGPDGAAVMFVGEQPGDQEDVIGRPFVGPAGQLMDRAMEEAGIDRRLVYITNAVKHFKFTRRGKRRIHQTPETPEIKACSFWLDIERAQVRPRLLVAMGGSAARAVLGRPVSITRERGRALTLEDGQAVFVTVHPSYLLRIPDAAGKAAAYREFVTDLIAIRAMMSAG
ncbi:UdgX family uracil-DNA binding protein [Rhodopila sp.]|jgi:DNA polymerase|uniref:UdgX family uracil-DNA binding protein n=1 Tax=Rhodopila sp. TaxID=2480087 RepID=UPI002CC0EAA5|nr:UdgX family uracil-DNA binding protein [Rhodopila sp.]HVZ07292.1 UdgX family uracil-DNA binding protein [Rhodopila sp.]